MVKRVLLAAALAMAFAAPAAAHNCPNLMKEIDSGMAASSASAENKEQARELRADGERLHKEGKHSESMAALNRAKSLLQID